MNKESKEENMSKSLFKSSEERDRLAQAGDKDALRELGIVSSPTWEEAEREAWNKKVKEEFYHNIHESDNGHVSHEVWEHPDILADYWIERIRAAREKAYMQGGNAGWQERRKKVEYSALGEAEDAIVERARKEGHSDALKEIIPKILKLKDCQYATAYDEAIDELVSALSALIDQK